MVPIMPVNGKIDETFALDDNGQGTDGNPFPFDDSKNETAHPESATTFSAHVSDSLSGLRRA